MSCNCNETRKEDGVLGGVVCSAKKCEYNTKTGYCRASEIKVDSRDAENSKETSCSTFKIKQNL